MSTEIGKSNSAHQKAESQWLTPRDVADPFLARCNIGPNDVVLEPAAGEGALVPDRFGVIAFEKDPLLVEELRYWRPHASVINYDFLLAPPSVRVDVAVGNPPYHDDGEATFTYRSLLWAPRTCLLMRLVTLQGERRFQKCWRFVQVDRLAVLVHRPQFEGPGSSVTDFSPFTAYAAFECSMRETPLPETGYSEWQDVIRDFRHVDWNSKQ